MNVNYLLLSFYLSKIVQRDLDVKQLRVKELENIVEDQKGKLLESQKAIENNQSSIFLNRHKVFIFP